MRLIMEVHVSDGYTYDCTITYPIVAESPEDALCELEELVMEAVHSRGYLEFSGHELSYDDFVWWDDEKYTFAPPVFFTVDEYFEEVENR